MTCAARLPLGVGTVVAVGVVALWHVVVLVVVLAALTVRSGALAAPVLAGGAYAVLVTAGLAAGTVRAGYGPGPADAVTALRSGLVGAVTALVAASVVGGAAGPPGVVTGLAAVALVLDAVDGVVARRTRTSSPLGARCDMEVDAALIAVLAVAVSLALGPWVLLIGAMRYLYGAAQVVVPALRPPLAVSRARKVVAAVQGVVLTVAVSGLLPTAVVAGAVAAALASLLWSFGRDVIHQMQACERRR